MILRSRRIRPNVVRERDAYSRQARRLDARGAVQRGQDEEVQRHEGRGRVAGEGEDEARHAAAVAGGGGGGGRRFEGHGGEGGGLAGLHGHAAEVDGAAETSLDGRFEQVQFAHGGPTGGDDYRDAKEGRAEGAFEVGGPVVRGLVWLAGGWGWCDGGVVGDQGRGIVVYLSLAMPRSTTSKPQPRTAAITAGRLQSRTSPSRSSPGRSCGMISSPVLRTPTTGFL